MKSKNEIYLEEVESARNQIGDKAVLILQNEAIKKFALNCLTKMEKQHMELNKQLYNEMQERLKYLQSQEQTEEIKWRMEEITLGIIRLQQLLLNNLKN